MSHDTLTVKEVAQLLGYERKYVYDLIAQGVIPKLQRGPRCRILVSRAALRRRFPNAIPPDPKSSPARS